MNPDKRLDVKLSLVITDNAKPFFSTTVAWDDLPYADVLDLETRLMQVLADIQQATCVMLETAK